MSFEMDAGENSDSVPVLKLVGALKSSDAVFFREKIAKTQPGTSQAIYLDCSELNYLDSSGLGLLFSIYYSLKKSNVRLVILNPSVELQKIIDVSNLDRHIQIEFASGAD